MKFLIATAAAALAFPVSAQTTSDRTQASSADAVPAAAPASGKAVTVSGSVAIQTDYRLRGASQNDRHPAVQGSLTIAHRSGLYVGTFASNLAGWGTFGGSNLGLDAIGGLNVSRRRAAYLQPSFGKGQDGTDSIAGSLDRRRHRVRIAHRRVLTPHSHVAFSQGDQRHAGSVLGRDHARPAGGDAGVRPALRQRLRRR